MEEKHKYHFETLFASLSKSSEHTSAPVVEKPTKNLE
jgi:hypothetical protein